MKDYATNRKATFNYEILEKFTAGIALLGPEVKSIKQGKADLNGAYVVIYRNEIYLINCYIPPYQAQNTTPEYQPDRKRKLLMKKKEILRLRQETKQKHLTLTPLRLYNTKGLIKLELGLARSKKKFDKRESIRKKDIKRKIERTKKEQY